MVLYFKIFNDFLMSTGSLFQSHASINFHGCPLWMDGLVSFKDYPLLSKYLEKNLDKLLLNKNKL